jgi:membrane-associated phospholipid phosphatase
LVWNPAIDLTVTGVGAAAWIAGEWFQPTLAPASCHWCEVDALDDAVREKLLWTHPATADTLSDVTGFALAPLAAIGLDVLAASHDGSLRNWAEDGAIVFEATAIATGVHILTKILVGRERPFVHALAPETKSRTPRPSDNNLSFFSGHTTGTFALAASAGTVATMRGYRWAPLVWGVGGAFAVTTGYLRIAADKHWLTDVVVGMLVGAGIGIGVPYLFHRPESVATTSAGLKPPPPRLASFAFAW